MSALLSSRIETHDCPHHKEVVWYVSDVFMLPYPICTIPCAEFQFAGASWRMELGPNPADLNSSLLMLQRKGPELSSTSPLKIRWSTGVKYANGVPYRVACGDDVLTEHHVTWTPLGSGCSLPRSEFMQLKNSLSPIGQITAFCFLNIDGSITVDNGTQTRMPGPSTDQLVSDFRELLLSGENSDVTIRVKDKEFRAHRVILGARVPVFLAMFKHQMTEAITGKVSIDDCDPDTFFLFLSYIYTGSIEDMPAETVYSLYSVADKYQVDTLKAECVSIMRYSLSVETFCNTTTLALQYHEADLLKHAMEYFSEKVKEILQTDSWKDFMSRNPEQANELLVSVLLPQERPLK